MKAKKWKLSVLFIYFLFVSTFRDGKTRKSEHELQKGELTYKEVLAVKK